MPLDFRLPVSEKFKSIQGEGLYAGTPMAFIRFQGCTVGKGVCRYCDTDFETMHSFRGGGLFTELALAEWTYPYSHVCLTGGEPLDHPLERLIKFLYGRDIQVHIETSGTIKIPKYLEKTWICVSPKPGYLVSALDRADEIKVILPGLSDKDSWAGLQEAIAWSTRKAPVYIQPRNDRFTVDQANLRYALRAVQENPSLRLSTQMHKTWGIE